MALTRAYVHSLAAMGLKVDQILSQVNRMLVRSPAMSKVVFGGAPLLCRSCLAGAEHTSFSQQRTGALSTVDLES